MFSLVSSSGVNLNGIFSTAFYSLLKLGNENCCEELKPTVYTPPVEQQLPFTLEPENNDKEDTVPEEEPKKNESDEEEKPKKPSKISRWVNQVKNTFTQGTLEFIGQITEDESDNNNDNN